MPEVHVHNWFENFDGTDRYHYCTDCPRQHEGPRPAEHEVVVLLGDFEMTMERWNAIHDSIQVELIGSLSTDIDHVFKTHLITVHSKDDTYNNLEYKAVIDDYIEHTWGQLGLRCGHAYDCCGCLFRTREVRVVHYGPYAIVVDELLRNI